MNGDYPAGMEPQEGVDKEAEAKRMARLDAFGQSLAKKRKEAIDAREKSGIEQDWTEDEEFYQGIDDANRNEHSNAWRTKPPGQYIAQVQGNVRSTIFVNITRPYCDAASARFADMILPGDDRNWEFGPTPVPDLLEVADGRFPPEMDRQLQAAAGGDQGMLQRMRDTVAQEAEQIIAEAKKKAEAAERRIDDWHVEGQWHAEVRKVIESASRVGTGILKGPVPVKRRTVALREVHPQEMRPNLLDRIVTGIKKKVMGVAVQEAMKELVIKEKIDPTSKAIDVWDFYPAADCGADIHNGSYVWERDRITAKQLQDLKGQPGYIDSQIDLCLEEGPLAAVSDGRRRGQEEPDAEKRRRFEIWHMHGTADKDDMIAAGCECQDGERPLVPCLVTMVNNRVIKAALNPLDDGDYPYDVFPWQRRTGMPWGSGVARHGRNPQRIVNAATRNMMDNGGLSAGGMFVLKQGAIVPADGQWNISNRKIWLAGPDGQDVDVSKAFQFIEIPSRQAELMAIVQFGLKMMEDSTGMPALMQGQMGEVKGEPLGTVTLANNNASAVLRRLARTFDDCLTEPHIRRYYKWLLQYGDDSEKGDFQIDARGSSALVERELQSQEMPQIWALSQNPTSGLDPKKTAKELLKSRHFDVANFEYDDKEWQQLVANLLQKQQQGDSRVQVAQIQEQAETQREAARLKQKADEAQLQANVDIVLGQLDQRIAEIKATGAKEISFEELKAEMAGLAMKLRTEIGLSNADRAVDLHKHVAKPLVKPPVEPRGRAKPGKAFYQ